MKKIISIVLFILAIYLFNFIGTGFMKQPNVALMDYSVSEDGTKITLHVMVVPSIGYIRTYKDENSVEKHHYLTFFSTFGGLNSSFGFKNEFVLDVEPDDERIYFYHGNGGFTLVLEKNEQTGKWEKYK